MTDTETGGTPRERYRNQVRAEVRQLAWEQIAADGASALSLNAIAKKMGMSGPALYRYFAGRDELITELVRDAYRSLADTVGRAEGAGADLAGLARALRRWALADPHRYFLVYGTPVPGYHAPDEITGIASEIMSALLRAGESAGTTDPFATAMAFWTRLHGVLSLELAGHFTGMDVSPEALFENEIATLGR
ncbi:TetR/AcrR family transcriptional regulator [Streptomyces sp. NPDC014870]|uniref:TetR/AcrR family transcriptional regulator n=1 Tax=Streptomyces sp. NPDC014870 TaxID=3364925 RepID=UPI003700536D